MSLSRETREALKRCTNDVQRRFLECGIAAHAHKGVVVLAFWDKDFSRHFAKAIRDMGPGSHYIAIAARERRKIGNEAMEAMHKKLGWLAPKMLPASRKRARSSAKRRTRA